MAGIIALCRRLALASLKARIDLVDDINAALAAYQTVGAMAALERFKRVLDLHLTNLLSAKSGGRYGFSPPKPD